MNIAHVTLHVGLRTFRPVKVDDVEKHHMHSEFYIVEEDQAKLINDTKKNGGRVISVGTTSCRTLESAAGEDGIVKAGSGWTEIFIYPGYKFKAIDGLITNFHLPESTLLMLVSALAGKEHIMAAYEEAVKERYRFFSFGGCHDDRIRFKITFYINNIPTDRSMETCIITGSVGILFFVMLFILHCQSLPM